MPKFDIQPQQDITSVGDFAVAQKTPANAQFLSNLANVAGQAAEAYQKYEGGQAKKGLIDEAEKVARVKAAVDTATDQGAVFKADGGITYDSMQKLSPELQKELNSVAGESSKTYAAITSAVSSGKLSATAAALKLEATLRQQINRAPGFAPELRALARDIAGYDPSQFHLRAILDFPTNTSHHQTAAEKQWEQAQAIAGPLGVDPKDVNRMLSRHQLLQFKQEDATNQLSLNNINADQWLQTSRAESFAAHEDLLGKLAAARKAGHPITDPQQQLLMIQQIKEHQKTALFQQFRKAGKTLTTDIQNKIISSIDTDYKPMEEAIRNNGLGKVLGEKLDAITKLDKVWGRQTMPALIRYQNAAGPQLTGTLLEMLANTADPDQFNTVQKFFPGVHALVENGLDPVEGARRSQDVFVKILSGEQLTDADLVFRPYAENMAMQPSTPAALRSKFILGMGDKAPVRAATLLSKEGQRAQADEKSVDFMTKQFKVNYPILLDNVANEYINEGLFNVAAEDKTLKIEDGQLVAYKTIQGKYGSIKQKVSENWVNQLNMWNRAANNGWAADMGVMGDTFLKRTLEKIQQKLDERKVAERTQKFTEQGLPSTTKVTGRINRDQQQ